MLQWRQFVILKTVKLCLLFEQHRLIAIPNVGLQRQAVKIVHIYKNAFGSIWTYMPNLKLA